MIIKAIEQQSRQIEGTDCKAASTPEMRNVRFQGYSILSKTWNIKKIGERSAVDLAYKIHGPSVSESSKHILVLHGLLGSKRNWDSMCGMITSATKACVIGADARNHGDSPHSDTHTYLELASDVSQLMTKLSIKTAHIVGHSMGGRTGMTLALTEPSKVASLIIVDISPVSSTAVGSNFFPQLMEVLKSVNFQGANSTSSARDAAKKQIAASGFIENVNSLAFIIMQIGQMADKSYGWKCNLDALSREFNAIADFPSQLLNEKYLGPALFVGGGRSTYLPKADEPGIKALFPLAELKYIEHVGHNVHAEDPNAFFQVVKEFFDKIL